jgi:succinate dehydrogenase / fumarate reductase cytochrome b subunit
MARADRPLSPHLGIYRWQVTNTLSILHRATGVMLSLGAVLLVGWLISLVAGFNAYMRVNAFLQGPVGGLMLFGWTFCFFYHLGNGLRHLAWDAGKGFDLKHARLSGWTVVIAALTLTLAFWVAALAGGEG